MSQTPEFCSIPAWTAMSGMSKSTTYREIDMGNLHAVKRGANTLVNVRQGLAYLAALPTVKGAAARISVADDQKATLRMAAQEALKEHPDNIERARDLFIALLSREELLVLFSPWRKVATGDFLSAAAKANAKKSDAGLWVSAEKATGIVPASLPLSTTQRAEPPRVTRQDMAAAANAVAGRMARNLLQSFLVNGKPISQVTPLEARAWSASRRRDARFVELLCSGIPDSSKIGDFRTTEDAERFYDQAEKETKNA